MHNIKNKHNSDRILIFDQMLNKTSHCSIMSSVMQITLVVWRRPRQRHDLPRVDHLRVVLTEFCIVANGKCSWFKSHLCVCCHVQPPVGETDRDLIAKEREDLRGAKPKKVFKQMVSFFQYVVRILHTKLQYHSFRAMARPGILLPVLFSNCLVSRASPQHHKVQSPDCYCILHQCRCLLQFCFLQNRPPNLGDRRTVSSPNDYVFATSSTDMQVTLSFRRRRDLKTKTSGFRIIVSVDLRWFQTPKPRFENIRPKNKV